jgi:peptidoglycan L-alanyl-D-glutamate endopeptidase CwlK
MSFKLSNRSLSKLEGVHPQLVDVCKLAIGRTKIDFGIICGTRTVAEQEENVRTGRSKTMKSYHLPQADGYSHAIDAMAYVGSNGVWELNLYDEIADAFLSAAEEVGCELTWGAAWHKKLTDHKGTCEALMMEYVDIRRSQGRRPFLDGPHFQLET